MTPEIAKIESNSLRIISAVFVFGLICWLFILWGESKKDGFNTQRFFDLVFSSVIFSGIFSFLLYKLIEWLKIYYPNNVLLTLDQWHLLGTFAFVLSLVPIFLFVKKFKWSVFRILDIYAMASSVLFMILSLGGFFILDQTDYLIFFVLTLILYLFVIRHRGYRFMSGQIFSFFVFFLAFSLLTFLRKTGSLLFASVLVTIGFVNLYLRGKKTMSKTTFPEQFLNNLKRKLQHKEKKLDQQQQQLIKEDPYLQHGRATDNAETLDDVLEDTGKIVTDARISSVTKLKIQVRKALAAINLGKYGKCEICGKDIDKARLKAYPEATTCIDCATDHSQMEEVREDEILERNV
jgi:RNA polymerase-binding transcription factor DksA